MKTKTLNPQALEARIAPATFVVTNTADSGSGSLRNALAQADVLDGSDKIVFHLSAPSAHGENTIALTSGELTSKGNVTITGPGAGKLIIDAKQASRVFDIDDGNNQTVSPATISGISVLDGSSDSYGGGIYSTESLTLKSVVVSNCFGLFGGGVTVPQFSNSPVMVNISNSLITDNGSDVGAGGLDLVRLSVISIKNTVVTGNTALAASAGGIYACIRGSGTGVTITGCVISGNSGAASGGLVVNNGSTLTTAKTIISGTTIAGNVLTSGAEGGGVFIEAGSTLISGSIIRNNRSSYNGGGIAAQGSGSLTISKTTISGNQTTAFTNSDVNGGGGLLIDGLGSTTPKRVSIANSHIDDNRSANSGGGLLAINGVALSITGSSFSGNNATASGGGLSTSGTGVDAVSLTVSGSTFSDNYTGVSGGGLSVVGDGQVSISSSTLTGNLAESQGGGLYARSYAIANGLVMNNVIVSNNVGVGFGGGMAIVGTTDFYVNGGYIAGNRAQNGGGIRVSNSSGDIRGVAISGNVATVEGGGVSEDGSGMVTLQIAKVNANAAPSDPNASGVFAFI
jgi:hypothetical protein